MMPYKPPRPPDPQSLTNERKTTHGSWLVQSALARALKLMMRDSENFNKMQPHQCEALDQIMVKISRILTGNPNEVDHWDDIAGYAFLGKGGHVDPSSK